MVRFLQIRPAVALIFVITTLVGGAALGMAVSFWAGHTVLGARNTVRVHISQMGHAEDSAPSNTTGLLPVFKSALPAVVSITSTRIVKARQTPFFSDPFFQQFFGEQLPQGTRQQKEKAWDRA